MLGQQELHRSHHHFDFAIKPEMIPHYTQDLSFTERFVPNEPLSDVVNRAPIAPHQTFGALVHLEVASVSSIWCTGAGQQRDQTNRRRNDRAAIGAKSPARGGVDGS